MTNPIASEILNIPGRLIVDPTTLALASAPNFGGTPIGNAAEIILRVDHTDFEHPAEEYGSEIVEVTQGGDNILIGCFLRGFDKDAVTKVWKGATVSTLTGKPMITFPGAAGGLGSSRSVRLLYAPENTEEHPAVLLFRAIPLLAEAAQLRFSRSRSNEFGTPAIFRGIRDTSGRLAQIRLLEDMPQTLP